MLSTLTVLNTNDSGPGSLRAAITQADMDTTQDTIDFAPSATGTITLLSALPDLTGHIILSGPGASVLTVARSTASGTPDFGIFTVDAGAQVSISGLTITGGRVSNIAEGGGITNSGILSVTSSVLSGNSAVVGGGIANSGTLTLTNSTLSGNTASSSLEGIANSGGGIDNSGTLSVTGSTLSGNSADFGGGIENGGTLTVTNSTFSGNGAEFGGGLDNSKSGTLTVTDSTLSGNTAPPSDIGGEGSGGGISNDGKLTVTADIFDNPQGNNLVSGPDASFVSLGHDLFSDVTDVALDPTDRVNTDPKLGPLADNGGPTQTQALLPGSPAIDAGVAVPGVTTDQRGVPRPQGKAPDIGAFELVTGAYVLLTPVTATELVGTSQSLTATVIDPNVRPIADVPVTFQVTAGPNSGATGTTDPANGQTDANGQVTFTYSDTGGVGTDTIVATATLPDGTRIDSLGTTVVWTALTVTNTNDSGPGSLRTAIALADEHPGHNTIDFAPSVTGTITLLSALPDLSGDLILSGPGASTLAVAGSANNFPYFRVFAVDAGAEVTISGLTVTRGQAVFAGGGGISNAGTLTVTSSTISGNEAFPEGGGIYNTGTLTVTNSTISNNGAIGTPASSTTTRGAGGGIFNAGTLTVTNSTISNNSVSGEVELAGTGTGGGIYNAGTLTVTNSTLSGNSAPQGGGGIDNSGMLTVTDSTLSGNSAIFDFEEIARGGPGGGIDNSGMLTVTGSTIDSNRAQDGGGISNSGSLTISNSTISGNSANVSILTPGHPFGAVTVGGDGGGIANSGMLTVTDSTLSGNGANGFIGSGGLASGGEGGGIANSGTLTVTASLFANVSNIGSAPVSEENLSQASGATFISMGHNLFSDTPAVPLAPTDLIHTDPLLAPLGDYGGPTQTQALLPGSPAIDAGVTVPGVTTDQRGVPRPRGQAPDIGAFESRGFTLAFVSGNNQETPAGLTFPEPLVVRVISSFGEPVVGGQVTFSAPTIGASAVPSGNLATIGADGQAAATASANVIAGTYAVIAQASGAPGSVSFTLNNEGGTVASVQRLGVHRQPTRLLLFFSAPLDPARAQDTSQYTLTTTGRRPRAIAIVRATYDAATRSVTLSPHERLSLFHAYRLTVRGGGPHGTDFTTAVYGGGSPRWVGATGPGLSNSPMGTDGPSASAIDALFSRSARIGARRHRR